MILRTALPSSDTFIQTCHANGYITRRLKLTFNRGDDSAAFLISSAVILSGLNRCNVFIKSNGTTSRECARVKLNSLLNSLALLLTAILVLLDLWPQDLVPHEVRIAKVRLKCIEHLAVEILIHFRLAGSEEEEHKLAGDTPSLSLFVPNDGNHGIDRIAYSTSRQVYPVSRRSQGGPRVLADRTFAIERHLLGSHSAGPNAPR